MERVAMTHPQAAYDPENVFNFEQSVPVLPS